MHVLTAALVLSALRRHSTGATCVEAVGWYSCGHDGVLREMADEGLLQAETGAGRHECRCGGLWLTARGYYRTLQAGLDRAGAQAQAGG